MAQNPLQIEDVDNEVLREADDYLRKHKILELFEVSLLDPTLIPLNAGPDNNRCLQTARQPGDLFD